MPTILLNLPPHGVGPQELVQMQTLMPGYRVLVTQDRDAMRAHLDDVEIAGGWSLGGLVEQMPELRWYQQWMAGSDWLARHPGAVDANFLLTNASGVHAVQISEHVLALLLAWVRRLPEVVRQQAEHVWEPPPGESLRELYGSTLIMVGTGAIGARIARLAAALGMRVLAVRRDPSTPVDGAEAVYGPGQLLEVLPQGDFVVLAAPLTAATRGMFGPPEFSAMKGSAFLVNVGRGGLVQQEALIDALRAKQIGGAGLDVFEPEPLPADSPLWSMPNVILTPHYAGASPRYYERAMAIFLDNLRRYRDGESLRNLVDKRAGY